MPLDLTLKQHLVPFEEQTRLAQLSGKICMNCTNELTVGEYEASGVCSYCYWEAQDQATGICKFHWTPEDLAEAAEHEAAMEAV